MKEPENIKGVLPPSFRAWYQLLNRFKMARELNPEEVKTVVWFERHPSGLGQGYEFTLEEIKAKALDEFIEIAQKLADEPEVDNFGEKFYNIYSLVKTRFLKL